jgi:outer membrane immunogenic protein
MKLCFGLTGLSLTIGLAFTGFSASAADMYSPASSPAYVGVNWSGFYAGVNGGYAVDARNRSGRIEDNGGFGGGQIGYNWQGHSSWVLGVEADFEGAAIDHSGAETLTWSGGGTDTAIHHRAIDYFGTVRGRIGYAFGPVLPYLTGGFAYGHKTNEFNDTGATHPGVYKEDGMKAGIELGAGLEYKLAGPWSMTAEYQAIALAHSNATASGTNSYVQTADTDLHTFRVGLNYHFHSPSDSLK